MLKAVNITLQKLLARYIVPAALFLWVLVSAKFTSKGAELVADLDQLKALSVEQLMQIEIPTVYGASKHDQKISDAPSAVTIITRDEIQRYGHRTLADVLRTVRDFEVAYDRNYGHVGVRGSNRPGDFGGRVLFLVNGHRINDPVYETAPVGNDFLIDIDLIERVEIIHGTGSSLYGTNGLFGVVNVITRTGSNVKGGEVSGEAGSLNTYKGRATYGNVFKNGTSLLLSGTVFDRQGESNLYYKEFDQPYNNGGFAEGLDGDKFHSAFGILNFREFTLQGGYVKRRSDVSTAPYDVAFNDPNIYTVDTRAYLRLGYAREFEDELTVRAAVYWDQYLYAGDYPYNYADIGSPRDIIINRDDIKAEWWGAEFQISKRLFKTHRLTLGAEFRHDSRVGFRNFDIAPEFIYFNYEDSWQTYAVFLQDEWAIAPKLTLNAGVRYDHYESFGGTTNPRVALVCHPYEKTTLKLIYGQAFRAPHFSEIIYSAPGLQPEKLRNYEVVLEQAIGRSVRLTGSAFYNDLTDLISTNTGASQNGYLYENLGSAQVRGASLQLDAKFSNGLLGRASYTYQEASDRDGATLSNTPRHLAKFNLSVPVYSDKIFSGFELQYQSEVQNVRGVAVRGHVVANWTLFTRDIIDSLEASIGVYNVFDAKYGYPGGPEHIQEEIPQDGRTFRFKLTYRF